MLRLILILLHVLWMLTVTYVFWAATILFLGPSDPFLFIFWPIAALAALWHFPVFLLPPTIASFGGICMVVSSARKRGYRYSGWWPLVINVMFAICFFGLAETYRSALMYGQAWRMSPQWMHTHTFARSLAIASEYAPAHAELTKDKIHYIWSYSELAFVPDRLQPVPRGATK